jgi:hypothetical protein
LRVYLTIMLFLSALVLQGQHFEPILSEKHLEKIEETPNPVLKLRKYKRFLKRDSIKHARQTDRYWRAQTDSLLDVATSREKALTQKVKAIKDQAGSKIFNSVYKPWAQKRAEKQIELLEQTGFKLSPPFRSFLKNYLQDYFLRATQNDSMLVSLKAQLPSLPMPKELSSKFGEFKRIHPGKTASIQDIVRGKANRIKGFENATSLQRKPQQYSNRINEYSRYAKVLQNLDSLKSLAKAEGENITMKYLSGSEQFNELKKYHSGPDNLKAMPGRYKRQAEQLRDSAYIKEEAKRKAEEIAMNYIAEHPEVIESIQKKMNFLMRKYSVVPNSNDLSTAIKRSSLKGKTFKERLVFSGNFQVLSWNPFAIDVSPSVGYKFNRYFIIGVGGNYRQTFSTDTIPKLAPEILGYKAFASYDLFGNFFAYSEFDRNSPGIRTEENKLSRLWTNAAFMGIGRKVRIHTKVEMTIVMMYNLIHKQNDPIYPRPFVIKIGFQTSEIAMLKSG